MKCQILFSGKNKKNKCLLKILPRMLSIQLLICHLCYYMMATDQLTISAATAGQRSRSYKLWNVV